MHAANLELKVGYYDFKNANINKNITQNITHNLNLPEMLKTYET